MCGANYEEGLDVCNLSAEELACLRSFCPLGIDYQSQKDQNPRRITGTCLWALHNPKYLEWRDKDTKRLIWISADPGCGKSVLTRCIVDEDLPNASTSALPKRILYYFFKDTSLEQRSACRALCAVLHQLFTSCPRLIRHAMPEYNKRGATLFTTLPQLWSIFMIATADPTAGNVICIFDALDECDSPEQSRLIEYLGNFCYQQRNSSSMSRLKFLVTSRPYFNIRREFSRAFKAVNDIELAGTDESASIKKEIDLVIEHRIVTLEREDHLKPEVTDHLRRRLLQVEHRTYLWLHLLWEIIQKTGSGTKSGIDSLIDNLPNNVKEAYEVLLKKCPDHNFTTKVLQIVLVAARPLSLVEMDVALHIDDRTVSEAKLDGEGTDRLRETLPSRCGLMISVIEDKVYFIHQTVKEFLQKTNRIEYTTSKVWQQSLDFQKSHGVLAEACLRNLSFPDISLDQTNHLNALLPEGHREMGPNIYCRHFNFLSYSTIYWADHYREGLSDHQRNRFVKSLLRGDNQSSAIGARSQDYGFEIHAASFGGHREVVQILLDKEADVNAQGGVYGNALYAGSFGGHRNIVQILLDKGANVNVQGGVYGNALQAASCIGHRDIVQILLSKGADVNAQGGVYSDALQTASHEGHQEVVQMLLDKGADANAQGGAYNNALEAASSMGHRDIVQILLSKGVDVNAQGGVYGNTVRMASYEGHRDIVQMLLDKGVDVNAQSEFYGSALYAASCGGYRDIVQILLDKGAYVRVQSGACNALSVAISRDHWDIVQMLIDKGADINTQGERRENVSQAALQEIHRL